MVLFILQRKENGCAFAVDNYHFLHILLIKQETGIYMDGFDNFDQFRGPNRNVIRVFSAVIQEVLDRKSVV